MSEALSELDFGQRLLRVQQIANLHTITASFEWVWNSPFAKWLCTDDRLFWISGNPASGKSTLMNYIANEKETKRIMDQAYDGQSILIYHFFDFRAGKTIGNSFEGLLRSLLLQVLKNVPSAFDRLPAWMKLGHTESLARSKKFTKLGLGDLRDSLTDIFQHIPEQILMLLDGLDEYAGEKIDLISFVKALCSKHVNLKLCLASRPEPLFRDAFEDVPTFQMHVLNRPGICGFAHQYLKDSLPSSYHKKSPFEALPERVADLSQGIFLWARFAVYSMISGLNRGEDIDSDILSQRLEEMPSELEEVYARIIQNSSPQSKGFACRVLSIVTSATQTITFELLQFILAHVPKDLDQIIGESDVPTNESTKIFIKRALAATHGLIEALPAILMTKELHENCHVVRLIHRTVETYLDSKGGWEQLTENCFYHALPHELWLHASSAIIKLNQALIVKIDREQGKLIKRLQYPYIRIVNDETDKERSEQRTIDSDMSLPPESKGRQKALSYSLKYIMSHASAFEELSGKSSVHILEETLSDEVVSAHHFVADENCKCKSVRSSFSTSDFLESPVKQNIHLAIGHSLSRYVEGYLGLRGGETPSLGLSTAVKRPQFPAILPSKWNFFKFQPSPMARMDVGQVARRYAVIFAIFAMESKSLATMNVALSYSPFVAHDELLLAVQYSSHEVIEKLLSLQPRRAFWPTVGRDPSLIRHSDLLDGAEQASDFGLFWAAGRRFEHHATSKIIDLLLDSGEDINAQCSPFGTALHSLVDDMC